MGFWSSDGASVEFPMRGAQATFEAMKLSRLNRKVQAAALAMGTRLTAQMQPEVERAAGRMGLVPGLALVSDGAVSATVDDSWSTIRSSPTEAGWCFSSSRSFTCATSGRGAVCWLEVTVSRIGGHCALARLTWLPETVSSI